MLDIRILGPKTIMGLKRVWVQYILDPTNFGCNKIIERKKVFGTKKKFVQDNFR